MDNYNNLNRQRQIDISFCLPIFSVSPWLKQCIDSILAVDGITYEIICVDDCSTDDSYEVLLELANKHNCICALKNEVNRGVSYTRNVALEHARGRYIWFVDPDDVIVSSVAKEMVGIADNTKADFVFGNFSRIFDDDDYTDTQTIENDFIVINNDRRDPHWVDFLPEEPSSHHKMRSVCAGIYRREFLDKYGIRFTDDIIMCEDIAFNYKAEVYFSKMVKCSGIVYHYRVRKSSVAHTYTREKRMKTYIGSVKMYRLYQEYLKNGVYSTSQFGFVPKDTLLMRISRLEQNVITNLAAIADTGYVFQNLRNLKQTHIYPYKPKNDILAESGFTIRNILFYMAAFEPFFWLLHLLYKFYYRKHK